MFSNLSSNSLILILCWVAGALLLPACPATSASPPAVQPDNGHLTAAAADPKHPDCAGRWLCADRQRGALQSARRRGGGALGEPFTEYSCSYQLAGFTVCPPFYLSI